MRENIKEIPSEPIEQKAEGKLEASELEDSKTTAEAILKQVIRKEIVLKIQENFKERGSAKELPSGEEKPENGEKSERRAMLNFEYLRHNLLLNGILERVTERGILGTVKKEWRIILDEIQGELSQLSPESQKAIEKSIEGLFEKKKKIDALLNIAESDEIFSELIGDGKKHRLKGGMTSKTLGDILTIHLPNKFDFAKVYHQAVAVREGHLEDASRVGGFAHKRHFKKLEDEVDVIVFPTYPDAVYKSTLSHEVAHRINDRLFEKDGASLQEKKRSDFGEPQKLLNFMLDSWIQNRLKDELWNNALSGLMHYQNGSTKDLEKTLDQHVDSLLKQGKGTLYDYPTHDKAGVSKKMRELFPEVRPNHFEKLYHDYADKYYGFASHHVDFVKKHLSTLKAQWVRYDFLNLLRFEEIQKWSRIPRFLETIGENFNVLGEELREKYGKQYIERSEKFGNDELTDLIKGMWQFNSFGIAQAFSGEDLPLSSRDELKAPWRYDKEGETWHYDKEGEKREKRKKAQAFMSADTRTKALVLLRWVNYASQRSENLLRNYEHFGRIPRQFKE